MIFCAVRLLRAVSVSSVGAAALVSHRGCSSWMPPNLPARAVDVTVGNIISLFVSVWGKNLDRTVPSVTAASKVRPRLGPVGPPLETWGHLHLLAA